MFGVGSKGWDGYSIAVEALYGSVQLSGWADISIGCLGVVEYSPYELVGGLVGRVGGRRAIEVTRLGPQLVDLLLELLSILARCSHH